MIGNRTDRVMFFGKEGMITLNVVTIMRRIWHANKTLLEAVLTVKN